MNPSHGIWLTLIVAGAFAITRIAGATNVFFKDAAHLYVGGLFGASIVLWNATGYRANAKFYLALGIVLSIIETLVAVLTRIF